MSRKKTGNGARHGGWSNTLVGDGPFISIHCRGEESTPHDKWRIASLHLDSHNDEIFWTESVSGYVDHENESYFRTRPGITQYLVGEKWLAKGDRTDHYDDPNFRSRWALRCGVCGFTQVYARPRELTDSISSLARLRSEDGILEISARAFASYLRAR